MSSQAEKWSQHAHMIIEHFTINYTGRISIPQDPEGILGQGTKAPPINWVVWKTNNRERARVIAAIKKRIDLIKNIKIVWSQKSALDLYSYPKQGHTTVGLPVIFIIIITEYVYPN